MTNEFTISIKHPPASLSSNGRGNHWARYADSKMVKRVARVAARRMMTLLPAEVLGDIKSAGYSIDWYYKGTRPDDDNIVGRMKYVKDGVAQALGIDDGIMRLIAVRLHHQKTRAGSVAFTVRLYPFEQGGEG